MGKVTSKLQLTVPKTIADQYGIQPGDDLEWVAAGDAIRILPPGAQRGSKNGVNLKERLNLFDEGTRRQRQRQAGLRPKAGSSKGAVRGWKREDLYRRGRAD